MLSTPIRFLLFYFDLWGFCIGYSRSSARTACNLTAVVVQQIFLVSALIYVIYQHIIDVRLTHQEFVANDGFKCYTLLLTHWIVVMESYGSRESQHKYWMVIQKIQEQQIYPTIPLHATMFWYIQCVFSTMLASAFSTYHFFRHELQFFIFATITLIHLHVNQNRIHLYRVHLGIVYTHLAHGVRCLDQIELYNEAKYRRILCAFRGNCMLIAELAGLMAFLVGQMRPPFWWHFI